MLDSQNPMSYGEKSPIAQPGLQAHQFAARHVHAWAAPLLTRHLELKETCLGLALSNTTSVLEWILLPCFNLCVEDHLPGAVKS